MRRSSGRRSGAVAGVVLLVLMPALVPLPAIGVICEVSVDAAGFAEHGPARDALQAALDGPQPGTPAEVCTDWTVRVSGAFELSAQQLVYDAPRPLRLLGPEAPAPRASITATSTRILAIHDPAFDVELRRIELIGGDARAGDLDGAGGAVAVEARPFGATDRARITAADATFRDSIAQSGGALSAEVIELTDVEVADNRANVGGGISTGVLAAVRTTFAGNAALTGDALGGAVLATGTVALENSTFDGNRAGQGGSLWLAGQVSTGLRLVFVTLASAATSGGSGSGGHVQVGAGPGSVVLVARGSVFAGVTGLAGSAPAAACSGLQPPSETADASEVSLASFEVGGSCPSAEGGIISLEREPALGPLLAAGGITRSREPAADSPLLDVVPCDATWPLTDQRGRPRPQPEAGRCAAGAVEPLAVAPELDERGHDTDVSTRTSEARLDPGSDPRRPMQVRAGDGPGSPRPLTVLLRRR